MKLTDTAVRNARAGDRPRKLFDGDGLYLFLSNSLSNRNLVRYLLSVSPARCVV